MEQKETEEKRKYQLSFKVDHASILKRSRILEVLKQFTKDDGNLGDDIIKYYRKGDYVIVEGVLNTIKNNQSIVDVKSEITSLQLTILKIYPLFTI